MSSSLPTAAVAAASRMEMLPSRLMRFFTKYPPSQYSVTVTGQAIPTGKQRIDMGLKPISSTNLPQQSALSSSSVSTPTPKIIEEDTTTRLSTLATQPPLSTSPSSTPSPSTSSTTTPTPDLAPIPTPTPPSLSSSSSSPSSNAPNPFLPYKNPATGRWRGAKIGLRNQADLFRLARQFDVEDMLPASIKSSAYKHQRVLERGLAVRGTGEGQTVKGHKWERTKVVTLEKRRKAMEEMPELIRLWEQRGHGRGWKKFPSGRASR